MRRKSLLISLFLSYRDSLAPKIETIQDAIGDRHLIKFQYYAPTGEGNRTIEPYYLVFRWSSWYLWGWCTDHRDYRMFKLNRMDKVMETSKPFEVREVGMPEFSNESVFPGNIKVKALFDADMKWRLVEEFGHKCFTEQEDGKLLFTADYTNVDNLTYWLLTFGDKAEVLEPLEVREKLYNIASAVKQRYSQDED